MEIQALLRGELTNLLNFITIIRGIPLPYTYYDKEKKKKVNGTFMLGISPILPVSIRFPKDQLNTVLGILKPEGKDTDHVFNSWERSSWKANILRKSMRKAFNLDPLPKSWPPGKGAYPELIKNCWVATHIIGTKEDEFNAHGTEII